MTDRPIIPVDRPYVKHDPVPQFDESRPHPYADPLQPNGALTSQTPNATHRITVRNPIRRMRNGTRDGAISWQETAEDLAKQLLGMHGALMVSRGLVEQKNVSLNARERRIATLEKQLENQRETIRIYRDQRTRVFKFCTTIKGWWAWRWFASAKLKHLWLACW